LLMLLHAQVSTVAIQLRGSATGFVLDVQLASLAEVLHTQAAALEAMARSVGLHSEAAQEDVWNARQLQMGLELVCKGTLLPSEIGRFAERVRGLGGESVIQGTGIMIAGFPAGAADGLMKLRSELEEAKGSLMILKQPANSKLDCWGTAPDSLPLMRQIKSRFDPEGILSPGRFLGHI
jgi:glycolate oxidase FAD binding subunit